MLLKNSSNNKILIMKTLKLFFTFIFFACTSISLLSCSNVVKTSTYKIDISSLSKASNNVLAVTKFIPNVNKTSINGSVIQTTYPLIGKDSIQIKRDIKKVKINIKNKIEIDTSSPISIGAIKIKKRKTFNWVASYKPFIYSYKKQLIANNELKQNEKISNVINKQNTIDRISTVLASNEKSISLPNYENTRLEEKSSMKVKSDDLVFFDYSGSIESNAIAKIKNESKSKTSETTIGNVTNKLTTTKVLDVSKMHKEPSLNQAKLVASVDKNLANDMATQDDLISKLMHSKKVDSQFVERKSNILQKYNSEYSISPRSIHTNNIQKTLSSFEIRFNDDIDEIIQDNNSGTISITNSLNSEISIRRAVLFSSGHIPLAMDLVFEPSTIAINPPMLTNEYFSKMLLENNLNGPGGHLLVELDDLTEDVSVENDDGYESKLYLSKNFKVVDPSDSDFNYILFVGINPGNSTLSFRTNKGEVTSKIVHVENDYILFDSNFYIEHKRDKVDLFEEYLLSKKPNPLSIRVSDVKNFSYDTKYSKKAINSIESNRSLYPLGTRKYLELSHLNESIFVGYWDKTIIDIPSEEYMRFIINSFNDANLFGKCVVQVNLSKSAKQIFYSGSNGNKFMKVDKLLLDKDGIFYDSFGKNTKKIFLLGQQQGVINLKIDYIDGSKDFIQTYCADSTYLVEQL